MCCQTPNLHAFAVALRTRMAISNGCPYQGSTKQPYSANCFSLMTSHIPLEKHSAAIQTSTHCHSMYLRRAWPELHLALRSSHTRNANSNATSEAPRSCAKHPHFLLQMNPSRNTHALPSHTTFRHHPSDTLTHSRPFKHPQNTCMRNEVKRSHQ